MTTSRQPWTSRGCELLNADGTVIALFKDARDVDVVIEQALVIHNYETKINEIQGKLDELTN